MNEVLDFLHIVRGWATAYLWLAFLAATGLLIADLVKSRAASADDRSSRERKAA